MSTRAKTKQTPAKQAAAENEGAPAPDASGGGPGGDMSSKDYDKALKKLHVELVKLQAWVQKKGLKVCIVFEGRDGAGKGGTIKAITERVSPRVFRVVALPARSSSSTAAGTIVPESSVSWASAPRRRPASFSRWCPLSSRSWSAPASSCSSTGWK